MDSLEAVPGEPVLSVRNLALVYNGQTIIKDLSFELNARRRGLLAGPSGCGKTSLFKSLLGLIRPVSGSLSVMGRELDRYSVWAIRRAIGYVPQEPDPGGMTAREFVTQPFEYKANHGMQFSGDDLAYWMDFFGLSPALLDQPCTSLSGGQKQRFAVILVILLNRSFILLDEPTSALDAASRLALRKWITESREKTFLIVTHDPELETLAEETIDLGRCGGGLE